MKKQAAKSFYNFFHELFFMGLAPKLSVLLQVNAVPGEQPSKFTTPENPYMKMFFDANIKMYSFTNHALW